MSRITKQDCQGQVTLVRRPTGVPEIDDFQFGEGPVPVPREGEFLCRTRWLSLDPYLRGVISGRHQGENPVTPGDVMPGATVATVVTSQHPEFAEGDQVLCRNGWQEFALSDGEGVRHLESDIAPLSTALGVLGMPGLTAYAGMMRMARPRPGDTVVVSAAAGPVGCVAGQIARIGGCRVVGIAGSPEKCQVVVEEFGFDSCINYRESDLSTELSSACPDGVDIYFDNVGGETLEAVLRNLAIGARVILCGLISQYNEDRPPPGPNPAPIIIARAKVHGLVVYDHNDLEPEFLERTSRWIRTGALRYREDITDGLENAATAFCRLMRGENLGKALVRLA